MKKACCPRDVVLVQVLSLIFFLSFFVSMLYYWGVLQFIVLKLGNIYFDIFFKFAKFARKFR